MKNYLLILFLLLAGSRESFAQTKIIGTIKDDKTGEPLIGATVSVKGTTNGVATDIDGRFSIIAGIDYPFTLTVNFVGYNKKEIEVYEEPEEALNVLLKSRTVLDEVVVVGYGTQKKGEVTGAISSIPDVVLKQPVSSIDRVLQGSAPGVHVTSTSGQPGGGVSIRIRGGSSVQGGNEPLYVIDGFPVYNGGGNAGVLSGAEVNRLSSLNPSDIESIEILKDASATAIYGSRGANGVIIITTKRGKSDKTEITYEATYGVQSLRKKVDVLNATDFAQLRNDAFYDTNPAKGRYQYLSQEEIDQLGEGTDWQKAAFRNASTQNHQLSITGGKEKTQYAVSFGYFDQEGIIRNTDFKRFSGRVNLDFQPLKNLKAGLNLAVTNSSANVAPNSSADGTGGLSIVSALLTMPSTATIYEPDGSYTLRNPFENIITNPIASLDLQTNKTGSNRLFGTFFGEYTLVEGLVLRSSVGTDLNLSKELRYIPGSIYEGAIYKGQGSIGSFNSMSWLNENTLTYSKTIGNHSLNTLAGFTQQEYEADIVRTGARGFVSDKFTYNSLQSGEVIMTPYSDHTSWALLSYLGRVNYNYDGKYFITASIRTDGSSRFGKNNKWGYFPSAAVSWRISNERFFSSFPKAINDLKLRASFGATGNQEIGQYQSLATLTNAQYIIGGTVLTGLTPSRIPNSNLGWETTYQFDGGLDIGLYEDRIRVVIDAYYKKTEDLLLSVEVPYTSGYSTSLQNYGSVGNRGLEIGVNTSNLKGQLSWTTAINFSLNRNEVLSIGDGKSDFFISGNYIVKVGEPLGTFYGTATNGILQTGDEAEKGKLTGSATPKPGDRLYKDISGDGQFTTALDRTILGNAQPKFIAGITNNFEYKGFDLSFLIQGSYGNKILNGNRQALELFNGQQNASTSALDRWTETNPSNTIPRAKLDPAPVFSDRFLEDGSFVRLKSLSLGYTIPQSIVGKARFSNVKVYVIAQNLWTWTNYTGYDPEVTSGNNTVSQGTDVGIYPVSRVVSAGLRASF